MNCWHLYDRNDKQYTVDLVLLSGQLSEMVYGVNSIKIKCQTHFSTHSCVSKTRKVPVALLC